MTFSYTRDIPFSTHNPSTDQPDMLTNTNNIDDLIDVDHHSFNESNGGKHRQSTYPKLASAPTTAALEGAVYTKDVGAGVTQLFYRRESNGSEIQITSGTSVTNVPTILSGTFTTTGAFTNIVLLPANVYGYIIFFRTSATIGVQMSPFVTTGTTSHGMSSRIVKNSSSDDDPVELNNNSASLQLQGRSDDFPNQQYSWRLHYWSV